MIIFDVLSCLVGVALIWIGATGRLNTIVTDPDTGQDMPSGVGNSLAIFGGLCVVVAAVF